MPDSELVDHIARTTGLSATEAVRVIDDVTAYYREPVEEFVRRRHRDLQGRGAKNAEIFATLADELSSRLVAAPDLTERQLRRLIYS
ncbi:hypothetical protein HWD35_24155 [Tsukamurella tyrosinosolvens]|uniref:Uncharacterized protein n=1 Tax=Tsukamurella tyrosinosolvens TaxID=57704 RepID=A0A1H4I9P4_TSUTY|nr:hypothetical protein [Tsukamurella tyrosinosolvens]AUN42597.1 hypothetical protein ASU32_23335 [Tsukamurella tyrosinosolvens]KXO98845.1 hypothetical protein AXK58_24570 [Tsukamurella tyrosinosolvens]KXP01819.1 hypothetical protein AXK59_22490 [Tsukamurella tyrosinosolvens]KZL95009.1 hypothetical protein AXX05_10330 [Tsukamurella tyrosinosolvens]MCA4997816.1 hypothetical protein [Tsukamurella tyrosinosolvens]